MPHYYIGLGNTFHDTSLAILNENGEILFAESTERRMQFKRGFNIPPDHIGISSILKEYCEPNATFTIADSWSSDYKKLLERLDRFGFFSPSTLSDPNLDIPSKFIFSKASIYSILGIQHNFLKSTGKGIQLAINELFGVQEVTYKSYEHHLTHAAYACYSSPFTKADCFVTDGFGESGALSFFSYENDKITLQKIQKGNESLGFLYELITILCGFDWFKGEEWKVMGLAPYGKAIEEVEALLNDLCEFDNGNLKYPNVSTIAEIVKKLYKFKRPKGGDPWEASHIAASGQAFFSKRMDQIINHFSTDNDNLVLGGGCALNSSYNGTILDKLPYKKLHVPSAPGDDGNAIGSAMLALKEERPHITIGKKPFVSPYLGSTLSNKTLKRLYKLGGIKNIKHIPLTIHKETAALLAEGKLVGWCQGRAEFGPRALGNRSILADPRPANMKDKINSNIKFREEFRPFAPSILHEHADNYFEHYQETPYMERTLKFKKEKWDVVPAVVHANKTGRLQTVKKEYNKSYYQLIKEFYKLTGVPIVLNTSFNIMGKPMAHSVEDAIGLFYTTGLDVLVINDYLIEK